MSLGLLRNVITLFLSSFNDRSHFLVIKYEESLIKLPGWKSCPQCVPSGRRWKGSAGRWRPQGTFFPLRLSLMDLSFSLPYCVVEQEEVEECSKHIFRQLFTLPPFAQPCWTDFNHSDKKCILLAYVDEYAKSKFHKANPPELCSWPKQAILMSNLIIVGGVWGAYMVKVEDQALYFFTN